MKKLLMGLLIALSSITVNANTGHFWFRVNDEKNIEIVEIPQGYDYTVTVNNLVKSASRYVSCEITFTFPETENVNYYQIYRCHGDGTHLTGDVNSPDWNMELHAAADPTWNFYEKNTGSIHFKDTFHESLIVGPGGVHTLSSANQLRYKIVYIVGYSHVNSFDIEIQNVFNSNNIPTAVGEFVNDSNDSQPVYYDLQGHSSTKPFKGVNIIKINNSTKKAIY